MKKALGKVEDTIARIAGEMPCEDGDIDPVKIKQLKELTAAAKELYALTRCEDGSEGAAKIAVQFEEEASEWAE